MFSLRSAYDQEIRQVSRVVYTGAFRFPDLDAAAQRVMSVGGMFEKMGDSVVFAGWEPIRSSGSFYEYMGFKCHSQGEFREGYKNPLARLFGFILRGSRTIKWLQANRDFDVVVAYNPPALFALRLIILCRAHGAVVVLDNTEWYESEHLPGGRFGPAAAENLVRMRFIYPLFHNVICISNFLYRYYGDRNVIRIPPLSDIDSHTLERPSPDAGLILIYAGDAGKKDRLIPIIRELPALQRKLQRPVILRIAGVERESIVAALAREGLRYDEFSAHLLCLGRVSRARVKELYAESHFSILFREDKRYARAGFPTKAVESWASGCPIIGNPVGDFGSIATHLVDAILIEEVRIADELACLLKNVLDNSRYDWMSRASIETADRIFSTDINFPLFKKFREQLGPVANRYGNIEC